ncbi:MAG: M28 family peptidase, partial [Solitalea sp.]
LAVAEAFVKAHKAGKGPRRSILFMTVTAEEKGLLGSRYYSDNPVFPLENTITNLNIDMIGRVDSAHADNPEYVYIIGSDKLSTELHAINEQANATYTQLELDYTYNEPDDPNRFYYRSDHYNFAKHGIPIVFYFNGVHEDYHKHTDEIDKINFDMLTLRSRLVFHTAWELANREERPKVDVENAFPSNR